MQKGHKLNFRLIVLALIVLLLVPATLALIKIRKLQLSFAYLAKGLLAEQSLDYDQARVFYAASREKMRNREAENGLYRSITRPLSVKLVRILGNLPHKESKFNQVLDQTIYQVIGHERARIPLLDSPVFSPDGKSVATGSGNNIVIFDVVSGKIRQTFRGHSARVESVVFSPDGKKLASGSEDKTAMIWDAASGKMLNSLPKQSGNIYIVRFSPDGSLLATSHYEHDNFITIWKADTGELVRTLKGHHNYSANCIAFSPDGKIIASGGSDKTIEGWDVSTGVQIFKLTENAGVSSIAFIGEVFNVKILTSSALDGTIGYWIIGKTKKPLKPIHKFNIRAYSISISPDGEILAAAGCDVQRQLECVKNSVKLFNEDMDEPFVVFEGPPGNLDRSISFSPDGRYLMVGGSGYAAIWELKKAEIPYSLAGHQRGVTSVSYSPDGKTLASASRDKTIKLWDVETHKLLRSLEGHSESVLCVSFSPDGKTLASGSSDNSIKVWDAASGNLLFTLDGHQYGVKSVAFSPDGKTLASGGEGSGDFTVKIWSVETKQLLRTLEGHTETIRSVAFSPDGKILTSVSYETVKVWDVSSGKCIRTYTQKGRSANSVAFSPDGRTVALGGTDSDITLWDVVSGKRIRILKSHTAPILSVSFSRDGKFITSADMDGAIKLWDVNRSCPLFSLPGHTSSATSMAFSPSEKWLASGSADATVRLWPVGSEYLLMRPAEALRQAQVDTGLIAKCMNLYPWNPVSGEISDFALGVPIYGFIYSTADILTGAITITFWPFSVVYLILAVIGAVYSLIYFMVLKAMGRKGDSLKIERGWGQLLTGFGKRAIFVVALVVLMVGICMVTPDVPYQNAITLMYILTFIFGIKFLAMALIIFLPLFTMARRIAFYPHGLVIWNVAGHSTVPYKKVVSVEAQDTTPACHWYSFIKYHNLTYSSTGNAIIKSRRRRTIIFAPPNRDEFIRKLCAMREE